MIHWPPDGRARPDVWERFLEAQADGLARAVGVSNYSVEQLDELEQATGRLPAVNQIEWGPALHDAHTLDEHRRRGVQLEGYSPLKTTDLRNPRLVRDRRRARGHSGAGGHSLAPRARDRRHPEVDEPRADRRELRVFGFTLTADEVAALDDLGPGARRD